MSIEDSVLLKGDFSCVQMEAGAGVYTMPLSGMQFKTHVESIFIP